MARSDPQVNFRIPADLKDKIEAAAADNGRSITGELVTRLEASFDAEAAPQPISVGFDDSFLQDAGLTREQFGAFVRKSFSDSLKDDKGSE